MRKAFPADVMADARHDGRTCRCGPLRDVRRQCRRLVTCRPDAEGNDKLVAESHPAGQGPAEDGKDVTACQQAVRITDVRPMTGMDEREGCRA